MRSKREQLKFIAKNLKSKGLEKGFDLAVAAVWLYGVGPLKKSAGHILAFSLPLRGEGRRERENPPVATPATSPRRGGPPSPRQERAENLVNFVTKPVRTLEELSQKSALRKQIDALICRGIEKAGYAALLTLWVKVFVPIKRWLLPRPITPATSPQPSPRLKRAENLVNFVVKPVRAIVDTPVDAGFTVKPVRAEASKPGNAFDYLRLFKRAENSFSAVEEPANAGSGVLTAISTRSRLSFAKLEWSQPPGLWDRIDARGLEKYFYGLLLLGWVKIIRPLRRGFAQSTNLARAAIRLLSLPEGSPSPSDGEGLRERLVRRTGKIDLSPNLSPSPGERVKGFTIHQVRTYEDLDKSRIIDLDLGQNRVLARAWAMIRRTKHISLPLRGEARLPARQGIRERENPPLLAPQATSPQPSPRLEREARQKFAVFPVSDILPNQALAQSYLLSENVWPQVAVMLKTLPQRTVILLAEIAEKAVDALKEGMVARKEQEGRVITVPPRKPTLEGVIDRRSPFYRPRHRNAVPQKFALLYAALSKLYYRPRFARKPVKFQTEVAFYEDHLAVAQFWRPPTLWEKILQPISAFLVILSHFLSSVILRPLAEESRLLPCPSGRRGSARNDAKLALTNARNFSALIYRHSLAPKLLLLKERMIASDEALAEEFRQDPILKYLQKFTATMQKIAATVSIIFLTFAPLAPPLAAETTILTDADVNLLNPVLQQIAEVTGNEGSNLIADIKKRVEEIANPLITRPALPQEAIVELKPLPDNPSGETSPPANEASEAEPPEVVLVQENGTTTLAEVISVTPIEPETPATPTSTPTTTLEAVANPSSILPSGGEGEGSPASNTCDLSPTLPTSGEGVIGETATSTPTTTPLILPPPASPAGGLEGGGNEGEGEQAEQACQPQSQNEDQAESQELLTDDNSLLDTSETVKNLVEIINTNSIKVVNEVKGQALTGQNQVVAGDEGRDALIASGDINVFTNVLNVVNTNLLNSKIVEIAENFNNLSADVLLNEPETRPQELTQDLVSQVCTALLCESLNSFNLTNRNYAEVENTVDLLGHSGQNFMQNIEERGTIRSGDVNAVVNILNIVNSNLLNSRWTIASINVFGDWEGDLVLPSELYFTDFMSIGATQNSDISVEDINKVIINVENDNNVEVSNNILVDSDSGQNELEATGTPDGKKGELENSQIAAGQSDGAANVKNFLNTNVFNGRWYLGMVNTLGNWSGDIFSLPEEVALGTTPAGLSFFASNQKDNDLLYQKFEETIAEISKRSTTTVDILNQNQAKLTNNVDLRSYSGENQIAGEQIDEGRIFAGNTYALANILNFANTNLINADLHVGMVNVLGRWNGNIVFGFPDLTVSQKIPGGVYPMEKNRTFDYEISYGNLGGSSMIGSAVEWQYDPGLLKLKTGSSSHEAQLKQPGKIVFSLGKLTAQTAGKISFKLQTLANLAAGQAVQTYARISGIGPERNKTNNEHILVSNAVDTPEPPGSPPPEPEPDPEPPPPGDQEQQPPPGSGQGGGNPGGGAPGGSNPDSQGSGNPRGLLRIYKTNTGGGVGIKPGGKLDFTLTIDNDGIDTVYNVIVFDTLRGPDGLVVGTKKFPLGKMLSREEVVITYELEVNPVAPPGRYTNSAYVEALNFLLQPIKSESTAVSAFTVDNPNPAPYNPSQPVFAEEKLPGERDTATTTEDTVLKDQKEPEEQENATSTEPVSLGLVAAAKTDRTETEEAGSATPGPFLSAAQEASALQINLPGLERPASKRGAFRNYSEQDKMLTIIIMAALIALGYATANLRHRPKEKPKS